MKKILVAALALFFVTATSGLVLADDAPAATSPAASTAPAKKSHKSHKGKHMKKGKKAHAAVTPAPAK